MKTFKKVAIGFGIAVLIIIFLDMALPSGGPNIRSPEVKQLSNLKQVGLALLVYATDHDGKFPKKIADVVGSYLSPDNKILQFEDPVTHTFSDWLYFPGRTRTEGEAQAQVLAASSVYVKHDMSKRIVVYSDISAAIVSEETFVQQLSKELNERTAASAALP